MRLAGVAPCSDLELEVPVSPERSVTISPGGNKPRPMGTRVWPFLRPAAAPPESRVPHGNPPAPAQRYLQTRVFAPSWNRMANPSEIPPKPLRSSSAAGPGSGMNRDQSAELLVELLHGQRQLSAMSQEVAELKAGLARRSHQMSVLQHVAEILAATPKAVQVAGVVLDVFVQEFGAHKCMVWILEDSGASYQPRAGYGLPRSEWSRMHLPAPNPFPAAPLVLFQDQWLEPAVHGGLLDPLMTPGHPDLYFVPF